MGIFHPTRHFALLACVTAGVAAIHPWTSPLRPLYTVAFYGALHASMLSLTLRARWPARRRLLFVVSAAVLGVSSVGLCIGAQRILGGPVGSARLASLLSLSSGIGAATYAALVRRLFDAPLSGSAILAMTLGCITATLVVLAAGIAPRMGGLWLAAAWWFAFSLGLLICDRSSGDRRA